MRRVRTANTTPERIVRRELHRRGFRFTLANRHLPGSPDLLLPRWHVAVFVHGCFWHGHSCRQGRTPATNRDFWVTKINANRERDKRKELQLKQLGWRVITVWSCEFDNEKILSQRMDALAAEILDICL